jgi:hypothetical protein
VNLDMAISKPAKFCGNPIYNVGGAYKVFDEIF